MHFPPVSDFPPIFEKFSDSEENFHNFTFSRKNSLFSSAEISDDLLFSHRPQISNFPPIFPVSVHFPPVSRKLLFPPTLTNFPSVLDKFTYFLHTLRVFHFPLLWPWCIYASPNARTGRPWPWTVCKFRLTCFFEIILQFPSLSSMQNGHKKDYPI